MCLSLAGSISTGVVEWWMLNSQAHLPLLPTSGPASLFLASACGALVAGVLVDRVDAVKGQYRV